MPLAAGTRLGRYVIHSFLGAGGMGEVYRARDTRLDRDVAIKILPEHFARDPDALARFQAEARAVAALEHPNILVIHDVGTEGEVCFAVMELLEGETLSARLARSALPWRKAVAMGVALAEGLGAAHNRGVVHRDLKPANIFVGTHGQVKILDFGLARRVATVPDQAETVPYMPALTEPLSVSGTVPYMAPEQVSGGPADARSDIFALGCVLYEMASGRRAFGRPTRAEALSAILAEEPAPLASAGKDLPADLERVIRHCLEKSPEERFQSARDLAFALRALLNEAPGATAAGLARPSARTNLVLTALLLGTAGVGLYLLLRSGGRPEPVRPLETLAVLPFVNVGGDPRTEYLSDGLADNLIRNLSQVRALKVRPFSSVVRYKGQQADVTAAGAALKVQAVVVGRVRQQGDDLSVSVELVDVAENRQLWGGQYHHKLGNLLSLQEQMAREIAEGLRLNLSGEEKIRLTRRYTEDTEAYRLYLLGRFHWNQRTKMHLERAIDYFQKASARDPRFALPYAGLADCYNILPGYGYTDRPARESFAKAREMAGKALELDPGLAEAHTALGYERTHEWDWAGAKQEFQKALQANPNYATAHHWYACYLATMGRHDDALDEIRRAQELDPSSLIINGWVAMILCYGDRLDEALAQGKEAIRLDPSFAVNHFFLGIIYRRTRQYPQAIAEFEKAVDLEHNSTTYLTGLGEVYGLSGQPKQARKILEHLTTQAKRRHVSPYGLATIYAGLGERDQALHWLEKAYRERDDGLGNLRIDPSWATLRADPRFQHLQQRMKFPE
jgi:TolB-like protein/Flp pilus assembly protein TadD